MTYATKVALESVAQGLLGLCSALTAEQQLTIDYQNLPIKDAAIRLVDALKNEPITPYEE